MKKYDEYKDSGIEWIGEIPSHWNIRKIKYNTYVKARVGWHGLKSDEFSTEGIYCVTGTDFKNGKVNWNTCYRVSEERYDEDPYIQLREDDLLITKDGTIGKIALVKNLEGKATLNSGVFVVRGLYNEYLTDYMYWVLQTPVFTEFVNFTSKGSTIIHLYQDTFVNLPFVLPPIEEQQSIAEFLNDKVKEVESCISKKQQLIELLYEEKAALINHTVTKGIDENAPMKSSGIDWLGDIPAHWEVKKLKNICSVRQGLQIPITERLLEKVDGSFEYITIKAINNPEDAKEYILNPSNRVVCKEENILVARTGATGEIITGVHGVFHNNFFLVDFNKEMVYKDFLFFYLKNKPVKDWLLLVAGTTTIPDLNHGTFYETPFLQPSSIEEQVAIVNFIISESHKINTAISKIEKEIQLLTEYKQSLIYEVVTGNVKVDTLIEEPLEAAV